MRSRAWHLTKFLLCTVPLVTITLALIEAFPGWQGAWIGGAIAMNYSLGDTFGGWERINGGR